MTHRITNIETPSTYKIPGKLKVGKQIILKGRVQYGCSNYCLNLQYGDNEGSNIALHFNPRQTESVVVCNTYEEGWQDEERDQPCFPFFEGCHFTLRFYVTEESYEVYVNGSYFMSYGHRIPFQYVKYLYVSEGVEIYELTFQDRMALPYRGKIPGRLDIGKAIQVQGAINEWGNGFAINFYCCKDGEDNGFHFNPRLSDEAVVLNAKIEGEWGEEERVVDKFSFTPGQLFDFLAIATEDGIKVFVDGHHFTTFEYRCSIDDMKWLYIDGDITIGSINYLQPLPYDFLKCIPSGIEPKDLIQVKGFFFHEGERFSINLMTGDDMDSDIAFHFNPRRDEDEIVMNDRIDGTWNEEERKELPSAFRQLKPFEVKIKVKEKKFKAYVNGKSCGKFYTRQPIELVRSINVNGDAYLYEVKLLRRMDKPYVESIPGNLEVGRWVCISGSVKKHAEWFSINLQCGPDTDCDIPLHFNPRLDDGAVIRNSYAGDWADEETDQPEFPFESSEPFEIFISCQAEAYKIYVDGSHFVDFAHRMPCEITSHILLNGDANFFEPEIY